MAISRAIEPSLVGRKGNRIAEPARAFDLRAKLPHPTRETQTMGCGGKRSATPLSATLPSIASTERATGTHSATCRNATLRSMPSDTSPAEFQTPTEATYRSIVEHAIEGIFQTTPDG